MSYIIIGQEGKPRRYLNSHTGRFVTAKDKATVFRKAIEAHGDIAKKGLENCFVVNTATMKVAKKVPYRKSKEELARRTQLQLNISVKDIIALGGSEVVRKLISDCISNNLKLLDYSNQI